MTRVYEKIAIIATVVSKKFQWYLKNTIDFSLKNNYIRKKTETRVTVLKFFLVFTQFHSSQNFVIFDLVYCSKQSVSITEPTTADGSIASFNT